MKNSLHEIAAFNVITKRPNINLAEVFLETLYKNKAIPI